MQLVPQRIEAHQAAALLAGCEYLDPRGLCEADDIPGMCEAGECFYLPAPVSAVYVITRKNGVLWIEACKATGTDDATAAMVEVIEREAIAAGESIAFQTARSGFARKLEKQGYRVAGWILKKAPQ